MGSAVQPEVERWGPTLRGATEIPRLWRVSEKGLHVSLHEGQIEAWKSTSRYTYILAGTQSGKTSYLPWIGARNIRQTCDPKGGNNDFLAVTATFDLFRLKFLPAMREVFEDALELGRYWPSNKVIELRDPGTGEFWAKRMDDPMWGRIILRAASSPGGLESATARGVILDEFGQDTFTAEAMEALDRRLSLIGGWIVGGTTPYTAFGWIRERVVIPASRVGTALEQPGDSDVCLVTFDSTANPAFSPEEFERARRSMPAWRFDLFYRGKLSRPAGQIFSCFRDRDVRDGGHKCRPFTLPDHLLGIEGIDFGTTNTAGGTYVVEEDALGFPTGRMILTTTYKGEGRHASEHAQKMQGGRAIHCAIGGAPSEDGWRAGYLHAGLPVYPPTERDVERGIDIAYGTIKSGNLLTFDTLRGGGGKPGFIDQLLDYSRKLDALGNVTDEIKDKAKYHFVDQFRYAAIGAGGLTGLLARFLPFDPRRHWKNRPMQEPEVTTESWWPRFGGLKWSASGAAAFVLGTTDPVGRLHIEGEVFLAGASASDMASAIKSLIKERTGSEAYSSVPIVANTEMFADLPSRGGGLVGESLANAFLRAGLSLTQAEATGDAEWSELRQRLEDREARSLSIDRSQCPITALTLLLIVPDSKDPAKPAPNSPKECGEALCNLLLLRPAAARREVDKKLTAIGLDPEVRAEDIDPQVLKMLLGEAKRK